MNISQFHNKIFTGADLSSWNYDEDYASGFNVYPYSMACMDINDDTSISIGTGKESPVDFIKDNLETKFLVDASVHPKIIDNEFGKKNIFYAKRLPEILENTAWSKMTLNIFKHNNEISGAIENVDRTPMMTDKLFEYIERTLKNYRILQHDEIFLEQNIGSSFFQIVFLKDEPFYKFVFETSGISFKDVNAMVENVYKSIPPSSK